MCGHAMTASSSMRWDERVLGREYDPGVSHDRRGERFQYGAMENKGLNIFNSKLCTGACRYCDRSGVQRSKRASRTNISINWSGNRVTCRDGSAVLKEATVAARFAVLRRHKLGKRQPPSRLSTFLRRQTSFAEDCRPHGPTPVRPDSFIRFPNF